jgi:aryl-alcohol dehydrogenase-like predicted oxidoreductase
MRYIQIPSGTGCIQASRVILGTTHLGTRIPDRDSCRLMDRYAELGGNTIDTARVYGDWSNTGNAASERIVGSWLRESGRRDSFVLITKGAHHRIQEPIVPRVNPDCIREDLELSLKNVGTHIDLYLLHRDDPSVPVSEIMPVLDKYVKAGYLRAIGCSNWTAERMDEANRFARENGLTPFSASEIQWSLAYINREMLHRIFDPTVLGINAGEYHKYIDKDIPLLSFTSIAWGYFTRLLDGEEPRYADVLNTTENKRRAEVVRKWSKLTGMSAAAISVAYITSHPAINAAACVGCSNTDQISDFMTAADFTLPKEFFDELDYGSVQAQSFPSNLSRQ